ncbi:MAG: hypothetical protein H6Q68_2164 [Firmicutes bacterium]|nr:hypothetical protein [Bacillota bacterium]
MDKILLREANSEIPPDIGDAVEVFLYRNLSNIISPNTSVLLTPGFQAGLQATLNDVGVRHNVLLPKDIKDILDVFVIANLNTIAVDITS